MTQQLINIGTTANDGTGDTLRAAFNKVNDNFSEVYSSIDTAVTVIADTNPHLGGNLNVNTYTITSTLNGNIPIIPDGTGYVYIDSLRVNTRTLSSRITNTDLILRGNGTGGVDIAAVKVGGGYADNIVIGGNVAAAGSFTNISASGNASVTGNATVGGAATVTGNLTANQNLTVAGIALVNDNAQITGNLRIGSATAADYPLSVSNATNIVSKITTGIVQLHLQSADNSDTALFMESYGVTSTPRIIARNANGIASAPSATTLDNNMFSLAVRGHDGTGFTQARAEIRMLAAEGWNSTGHGTYINFYTTPVNTTTMTRAAYITSRGNVVAEGSLIATEQLRVLGLSTNHISGNTEIGNLLIGDDQITSISTNGDITVQPNGTGKFIVQDKLRYLSTNVPMSSIGSTGDQEGDVAIDSGYIYYCTGNYDGSTSIWSRVALNATPW